MRKLFDALRRIPLFKVSLGFSIGIVAALEYRSNLILPSVTMLLGICFMVSGFLNKRYSRRWVFGLGVLIVTFSIGWWYSHLSALNVVEVKPASNSFMTLRIDENPIGAKKGFRWVAKVINAPPHLHNLIGTKCNAYVSDTSFSLSYGDVVRVCANVSPIDTPRNPLEFNFKDYYNNQGIYASAFIKAGDIIKIGEDYPFFMVRWAKNIQRYTLEVLKKAGFEGDEMGVLLALLIGDKQYLDGEIKASYSNVGAMHILAVSGMHVALIYGIFMYLLFFIRGRTTIVLRYLVILFILWLYAFIAGFSPSIVRATVMFSFVLVGKIIDRDYDTFNLICASFLTLLLINPFYIYDVGFLLSYAAVISIIVFYPLFKEYSPASYLGRLIFDMVAVSVAAQVLTLPLILYYFHQFPLIFIATNILLIPLTSGIIYLAIGLLVFSWSSLLSEFLFDILSWLLRLTNMVVGVLESIPYAVITGIGFSRWQMFVLFAVFILWIVFVYVRKGSVILISLVLFFTIVCGSFLSSFKAAPSRLAVYAAKGKSIILLGSHDFSACLTDTVRDKNSYKFMENSMLEWGYKSIEALRFIPFTGTYKSNQIVYTKGWCSFNGKTVFIPTGKGKSLAEKNKLIKVDYLVVTKNCKWDPTEILKLVSPKKIVVDGSVSLFYVNQWYEICRKRTLNLHLVSERGAFIEVL